MLKFNAHVCCYVSDMFVPGELAVNVEPKTFAVVT